MSKPWIHAQSSASKYGGIPEDYLEIHELMDSSKKAIADNRHRALTHNSWFIGEILPRVFGEVFYRKSDGKPVSVRDIGEQHVIEDYAGKFIPSAQDFIAEMEYKDWMQNGKGTPPSYAKIVKKIKETPVEVDYDEELKKLEELKMVSEHIERLNTIHTGLCAVNLDGPHPTREQQDVQIPRTITYD